MEKLEKENQPREILGYLIQPDTEIKWPILSYDRDGVVSLQGQYYEFPSTLQRAISSNYVLDSDDIELVKLFVSLRGEATAKKEEFVAPDESETDIQPD